MNIGKVRFLLLMSLAAVFASCGTAETKTENSTAPPPVAVDNTARNERDNAGITTTPIDQSETAEDLAISAKIRQEIVGDKSFSLNAHNVKIVTNAGVVTLRGPVKTTQERTSIEARAKGVAGVTRVDNLMEIETTN